MHENGNRALQGVLGGWGIGRLVGELVGMEN